MKTDKLKDVLDKIKNQMKKITRTMWILALIVVVAIAAAVAIYLNTRPYSLLFTGLSAEDASTVMTYLNEWGVRDYKWESSDTILVPEKDVNQLVARFVAEGYPSQGFTYSTYYDNTSALSTEAERNQTWLITVQERMGAVISSCFDEVERAVVNITQGQDRSYVLDSGNIVEAQAAILLDMRPGEKLSTQQATQIRNFVAHSVEGLQIDNVSLTDNQGNPYNVSDDSIDATVSDLKLRLEEETENKVRTSVKSILDPIYGEDNVKVTANVSVDVSNSIIDDHQVHLPEYAQDGSTNGAGIIGSRVYGYTADAGGDTTVGGTVGTGVNSDLPTVVEQEPTPEDVQNRFSGEGQIDFNNSTTDTHTTLNYGRITDCTVSVSINQTIAGNINMDAVRTHVASAAGIIPVATEEMTGEEYLESKISILCEPFFVQPEEVPDVTEPVGIAGIPLWVIIAAAAGLLLFVIILTIVLLLRGRKKKQEEEKQKEQEEVEEIAVQEELATIIGVPELEPEGGADVMSLQTEKSMELRKNIRQFVEENPEVAAQLLKAWLRGGDENA